MAFTNTFPGYANKQGTGIAFDDYDNGYDGYEAEFDDRIYGDYYNSELRSQNEFRDRSEPLPPGIDENNVSSRSYQGRDRGRDRDREQRDMRSRDDRDRGRDRGRRRSDYDRDRGRGGDWSQERDRSGRHRERSNNRDRSPMHSSYRGNSDSESKGSMYDNNDEDFMSEDGDRSNSDSSERFRMRDTDLRSESSSRNEDKGGDKWVCNQPSRTIILRGLHPDVDEKIIGAELMLLGLPVKDIRLIRRSSGVSRGFAFVEFHNVSDAQRWMEHTQVDNPEK